jgi:competence CoiA-like predicted nuclease
MPLVALTDANERVISFKLKEEDRDRGFRCPYCDSELNLVIPKHKIIHFRHHDASKCILSGESELHLECKEFLYNYYISTGQYDVELESRQFITNGTPKRIGDVVLFPKSGSGIKTKPVVIEVQNSNIELLEIGDRFIDWNNGGFNMLWVRTRSYRKLPKWAYVLWILYGGMSYVYYRTYKKIFIQTGSSSDPFFKVEKNKWVQGYLTNMEITQKQSHLGIAQLTRVM